VVSWETAIIISCVGSAFFFVFLSWYFSTQTKHGIIKVVVKNFAIVLSIGFVYVSFVISRHLVTNALGLVTEAGDVVALNGIISLFDLLSNLVMWFFFAFIALMLVVTVIDCVLLFQKPKVSYDGETEGSMEGELE